jgi:hypothetical protein
MNRQGFEVKDSLSLNGAMLHCASARSFAAAHFIGVVLTDHWPLTTGH